MSHFSRADELDSDYTQVQLDRFLQATKIKRRPNHCRIRWDSILARSAFRLYSPLGIIMYGISPTDTVGAEFGLIPVMNLTSSLLAVREHKKVNLLAMAVFGRVRKILKLAWLPLVMVMDTRVMCQKVRQFI